MLKFTSLVLVISVLAVIGQCAKNRNSGSQITQNWSSSRQTTASNRNSPTQRSDGSQNYDEQRSSERISFSEQQPYQSVSYTERSTVRNQNNNAGEQRSHQSQRNGQQNGNQRQNHNSARMDDSRSFVALQSEQRRFPSNAPQSDESRSIVTQRPGQSQSYNTPQTSNNQRFNTQRPDQNRNQNTQRTDTNRSFNTQRPDDNLRYATHRVDDNRGSVVQTSQCNTFEWQCDNGQCIDSSDSCDGVRNCSDGSDETTENCIATTCPRYAFRCAYGACVSGNAECNRKIDCVDGSDEATARCPTKTEEQLHGKCDRNSFQCDNGECINVDAMCDGSPDCSDSSDETVRYCVGTHCPTYAFRCGNGACISGKKKCDSRIDCSDGSDENWALCGRSKNQSVTIRPPIVPINPLQTITSVSPFQTVTSAPPTSNLASCRADNIPVNGDAYYQYDSNKKVAYGDIVENFVSVNYSCIENHYLIGNATNICLGGRWQSPTPKCKPRCSSAEIQGVTISANCFSIVNNTQKSTSCVRPVEPGTIAYVSCQRGYEKTGPQQTLTCRQDGRWSPQPQRCTAICGEINEGAAYVVGGATTNISRVPWHVGIYRKGSNDAKYQQICGGTIITSRIVISAMHCFWDASEGAPFGPEAFQVAVGKTYRDYSAHENYKPQFLSIENIFYIDGYNDLANYYADDIALLVLDKHIEFHSFIVPICLPQNLEYHEKIVPVGWRGITAGWGLEQSNGQPSPILKKIELPVVSREECKEKSSPEFGNFITSDKFCAGYLTGASVCQGDSGGGLVFPQTVRQKTTYIIRGIVSTGGNKGGSCDSEKYTTFTNIAWHMDFVNAHISKYEPKY